MSNEKKFGPFEALIGFGRNLSSRKTKEYVLGCGVTHIQPNGSASIRVQAMTEFEPHRLIIPAHVAPNIVVDCFNIDDNNQLISTGAIPGEAFVAYVETHLKMSKVPKNGWITLGITNLFGTAVNFSAAIIGKAL